MSPTFIKSECFCNSFNTNNIYEYRNSDQVQPTTLFSVNACLCVVIGQIKYKQAGKQQMASSLYSTLPETLETKHAKEVTELQSEVSPRVTSPLCPSIIRLVYLVLYSTFCPIE